MMSTDHQAPDDPFVERIARRLRAEERFDDTFEETLIAAIRAEAPIERSVARRALFARGWWSSPSIQLSPLAALAAAACLVAAASFGALQTRRGQYSPSAPTVATVVHDTVTYVRFVFVGDAKTVSLVGDFNAWAPTPLARTGSDGAWSASVPLQTGRHEYAFIVDGKKWTLDQFAPSSSDQFDAASSVITIGD
jgi:AMP-activated protein kinase-like protein